MNVPITLNEKVGDYALIERADDQGFIYTPEFAPGSIWWRENDKQEVVQMPFVCPCGCGKWNPIAIAGDGRKGWTWNKSKDKPTLTPSIQIISGCKWHGYLTDGEFRSC